jgi:hypothetical protein
MRAEGAERAVAALAASQHGALGTEQAANVGMTRKARRWRVQKGQWLEPAPGALVIAGSPPTWRQELMVGVLSSRGVISHSSAAALHGLDGLREGDLHVTVARGRCPAPPGFVVHRASVLDACDVAVVDHIVVTNVARTLCDLGAVAPDDVVEQALDDALRRGFSQRWIEDTLARVVRPGKNGSGSLARMLSRPDRAGRLPDSTFERLIERALRHGGLPEPVRQHPVLDDDGRLIGRIDVAWPEARLGIEATSKTWHTGFRHVRRDKVRDRRVAGRGWQLIYPSWEDCLAPGPFLADTARTYALRCAEIHRFAGGQAATS